MITKINDDIRWRINRKENNSFLIRLPWPFLHLFAQKEARGVSIKITLKPPDMEYRNGYNSNYISLHIRTTLDWNNMNEK